MINFIEEEVDKVIKSNGLNIHKLTDSSLIWLELEKNFSISKDNKFFELWEQLSKNNKSSFYLQGVDGWKCSVDKIGNYPCFLLLSFCSGGVVYKISSKNDLMNLLSNSSGFTYYLCSLNFRKILFFNFHDTLALFESQE